MGWIKRLIFFLSWGGIIGLLLIPSSVVAKEYTIDSVRIDVWLNQDGSALIEEEREFNFEGQFSYAYQYFNKYPDQKAKPGRTEPYLMTNFQVCELEKNQCYLPLPSDYVKEADQVRPAGYYYLLDQKDRYYLKWFYRQTGGRRVFTVSYQVKNAITLHRDGAEFYWQLIGQDWSVAQDNITASVHLPQPVEEDQIRAWVHGPSSGWVKIADRQKVVFGLNRLPPGIFFEARILLPREFFLAGGEGNLSRAQIIGQEEKFIAQTRFSSALGLIVIFLVALVNGWFFLQKLVQFWRFHKDKSLPRVTLSGRIWEPPSEIDPAQVVQLLSGVKLLKPRAFTATLLSLIVARVYRLHRGEKKKKFFFFSRYSYYLVVNPGVDLRKLNLSSIQKKLIKFLERVGFETVVIQGKKYQGLELEKIVRYCKKNRQKAASFFRSFSGVVLKENLREGYFDYRAHRRKSKLTRVVYLVPTWLILILLIKFLGKQFPFITTLSLFMILNTTFLAFIVLFLSQYAERRTEKGRLEAAKWLAFKRHLKEYRKTVKAPIDSLVLWEKYLVYGVALGISAKTLAQLPVKFAPQEEALVTHHWSGHLVSKGNWGSQIGDISQTVSQLRRMISSSYGAAGVGRAGGQSESGRAVSPGC